MNINKFKDRQVVGYMRVSTDEQDMSLQRQALEDAGIDMLSIYSDQMSGKSQKRPGLKSAIKSCLPGAVLVVWKLDRLGRSVRGVLETIETLDQKNVELVSLTENIDTTTPMGKMVMTILLAFAEMERNLISERTKAGLDAKRAREKDWISGPLHGVLSYPKRLEIFTDMWVSGELKTLKDVEILARINEPNITKDGKRVKDFSRQSWNNWKAKGFNRFTPPDFETIDK
jgi:DNA invertase Pin-like site-specific DNA recombinase